MTRKLLSFLLLTTVLGTGSLSVYAQNRLPPVTRWIQQLHKQEKQVVSALQKSWLRARIKQPSADRRPLPPGPLAQPQRTVFMLQDAKGSHSAPFFASGFLIEETWQGKRYVWGVTAKHIGDLYDGPMEAVFYLHNKRLTVPVKIAFTGARFGIDASLLQLEIPPDVLKPLPLGKDPLPGEELQSFGYIIGSFFPNTSRQVLSVSRERIFTSYAFAPHQSGSGYCGSALIDKQGALAAIHCGSMQDHSSSFAVPVSQLRTLLAAYHGETAGKRELRFNGHLIGHLNPRQVVYAVYVKKNGRTLSKKHTEPQPASGLHRAISAAVNIAKLSDPAHLEAGLLWQGADEVRILVFEEPPRYFAPQTDPCVQTLYTYRPDDHSVTARTFTALLSVAPL